MDRRMECIRLREVVVGWINLTIVALLADGRSSPMRHITRLVLELSCQNDSDDFGGLAGVMVRQNRNMVRRSSRGVEESLC